MFKPLLLAFSLLCCASPALADCKFPQDVADNARKWIDSGYGAGVVMATIDNKGTPCYFKYGVMKVGENKAVDENTLFEIGSITKVFTALTMARMAEQGQIKLDDSYRNLLPQAPLPKGADREITLTDLASQTSGLPRLPDNFKPADMGNPYADYSAEQLWDFLGHYTLTRPVGSKYEYSNLGFGLLGQALSSKAGKTYETLVSEQVINPLGLHDTGITLARNQLMRFASGHTGRIPVPYWDLPTLAGAGALRSSAADMVTFISAAMGAKATPLAKAFTQTETPRAETGAPGLKIGLGWHLLTVDKNQVIFHDGGTGGFLSFVGFDPAQKKGVVGLANSSTFPVNELALHVILPSTTMPTPRVEISISEAEMDKLIGNYYFKDIGLKANIRREGKKLMASFVGQPSVELHAATPLSFFLTETEANLEFLIDAKGNITGIKLTQAGQTFMGEKQP